MHGSFRVIVGGVWIACAAACSAAGDGAIEVGNPDPNADASVPGVDAARANDTGAVNRTDTGTSTQPDGATPSADAGPSNTPDASSATDGGAGGTCATRETCDDGLDNDCNGRVDEGCACIPGTTQRCYDGPLAQAGRGVCVWGSQRCEGTGEFGTFGACTGSGSPQPVVCNRMMDFRCNGNIDEGCTCMVGATRPCYTGPSNTQGVGACRAGMQTCTMRTEGSAWGACAGEVLPGMRDLCDGVDRDCDGVANSGCTCVLNAGRTCYSGPAGTQGVGVCRAGVQRCVARTDGMPGNTWGGCTGEALPGAEVCGNRLDDNCNGAVDEGCPVTPMCPVGFDLLNDPNNCGACGHRCAPTEACANGVCVGNGQLRVTMTWDRLGDMDLHVVPPCGTVIYYARLSACGGTLDHDSCPAEAAGHVGDACTGPENIFWAAAPAAGAYAVCAVPYQIRHGAVNFTVTVTRGTTQLRRWTGSRANNTTAYSMTCSTSSPWYLGSFTL
jgi:hypothetical protein